MRLRLVTIGKPKLGYAKQGWDEYLGRLQRLHQLHVVQLPDKYADDAAKILAAVQGTTCIVMEIQGQEYTSPELAAMLQKKELLGREISFLIGGPEGLPDSVRQAADLQWSLGRLTLPHDLAMVVTLEALYRASTIIAGLPYHK